MKSSLPYRPHIDGLRGVAILAVLFFHAKILGASGGFVGVDIFFVISGFLISSIIMRDLRDGTFSLVDFWERRIRRIIPALVVVMIFCAIAATALVLYPTDNRTFGEALMAQSAFVSNVYFATTDNYFDQPSQYSPLLHTWTLSVEEQFYVLFPLLALTCFSITRMKRFTNISKSFRGYVGLYIKKHLLILSIVILSLASLSLSIWLVEIHPNSIFVLPFAPADAFSAIHLATVGFYVLPARIWEFSLGILLALTSARIGNQRLSELISFASLAAMLASVFLIGDTVAQQGLLSIGAALGATMFIVANEVHRTWVATILSHTVFIWIGLISYSLYLWHWPLLVFGRIIFGGTIPTLWLVTIIGLSILCAWLSYRFIETPVRRKQVFSSRPTVFSLAAVALLSMFGIGLFFAHSTYRESGRIAPEADQIVLVSQFSTARIGMCFQSLADTATYTGLCRVGDSAPGKPSFVLWGDSHADAAVPLFSALGWAYKVQGSVFARGDCPPLPTAYQVSPVAGCADENALALAYIEGYNVKNVILIARWSYYVMGEPESSAPNFLVDASSTAPSKTASGIVLERNLSALAKRLANEGRDVYILQQVPEQFTFDPRAAFYRLEYGRERGLQGAPLFTNLEYQKIANAAIESLANEPHIHILESFPIFCGDGITCEIEHGDALLYRDENHLSIAGVMTLEPLFEPLFKNLHSSR